MTANVEPSGGEDAMMAIISLRLCGFKSVQRDLIMEHAYAYLVKKIACLCFIQCFSLRCFYLVGSQMRHPPKLATDAFDYQ